MMLPINQWYNENLEHQKSSMKSQPNLTRLGQPKNRRITEMSSCKKLGKKTQRKLGNDLRWFLSFNVTKKKIEIPRITLEWPKYSKWQHQTSSKESYAKFCTFLEQPNDPGIVIQRSSIFN